MILKEKQIHARIIDFDFEKKNIVTPIYFPSVSSYGLKVPFERLIEIVNKYNLPRILISSYDFFKYNESKLFSFIDEYKKDKLLFLDSGCYESYWFSDKQWNYDSYKKIIEKCKPAIYSSFDYIPVGNITKKEIIEKNFEYINKCDFLGNSIFVPIFHSYKTSHIMNMIDKYLQLKNGECQFIAVSEREIGEDILSMLKNLKSIRNIIDSHNENIILHILGCGYPLNILLYTAVGVDSFDSRDWAKRAFNKFNLLAYPLSYLHTFDCNCDVCNEFKGDYIIKVLLHNLILYENLINSIRKWIQEGELYDVINNYIYDEDIMKEIKK